jgi:glucose dehydrogenase
MKGADRMKLHRVWVLVICAYGFAANLSAQRITDTIKDDWPTYNGDYSGRRFSSLTQITPQNAAHLQAQWVFHTKTPGVLEATPVL